MKKGLYEPTLSIGSQAGCWALASTAMLALRAKYSPWFRGYWSKNELQMLIQQLLQKKNTNLKSRSQ